MELLTSIPPLDSLPNPHLVVVGEWWSAAARVLASRLEGQAPLVYLTDTDARDIPGKHTIDGRRTDLIRALAGGADSLANLRAMLLPLAGTQPLGSPVTAQAVAEIFDELAIRSAGADRVSVDGLPAIAIRFPTSVSRDAAAAAIDDMVQHAQSTGLPAPTARIDQRNLQGQPRTNAREARVAIEAGRVQPSQVTVFTAVRSAADWRPYERLGLKPDVPQAVLTAEIELEVVALRRDSAYAKGDPAILRELAAMRVESRLWEIAVARASSAEVAAPAISTKTLLDALRANTHARDFADQVQAMIAGEQQVPRWWENGRRLVACRDCHGLRTAILLEGILEQAMAPEVAGLPKFLAVEAGVIRREPIARAAVERILRAGRKHHLFVVVLTPDFGRDLGLIGELTANWLVTYAARSALPVCRATPAAADSDSPPIGWWQSSLSPLPQPVGTWFTSEEVAKGDRLLTGASHAHA